MAADLLFLALGVGLGCIAAGAQQITSEIMLAAAKAAAMKLTPEELEQDSILPHVERIRWAAQLCILSLCIASSIATFPVHDARYRRNHLVQQICLSQSKA